MCTKMGKVMSKDLAKINGKSVRLREPYQARTSEIVGRKREMRRILAAFGGGL